MKYDIRINNVFYREIEGRDIESALNNAGLDVDFTVTGLNCGRLHFDEQDLLGILRSDPERNDEIWNDWIVTGNLSADFGEAE